MNTWIFQGTPDRFDIDSYLSTWPNPVLWLVTKSADKKMAVGDRVFLWRNQGSLKAVAGVIAEARIAELPRIQSESSDAEDFWRSSEADLGPKMRVRLRLIRVARPNEVIRRDWLIRDPVLSALPNLKMASGTNYRLLPDHAQRLAAMWARTGQDWTRDEAVAGLWAYAGAKGGPVSELPGSPVADVSLAIGRPLSAVYNKVMNFRALDPTDSRAGLRAGSAIDRSVWTEFFDESLNAISHEALEREYERLWRIAPEGALATSRRMPIEESSRALVSVTLDDLLARYRRTRIDAEKPAVTAATVRLFDRNPLVVFIAKRRAGNRCEIPGCKHELFPTAEGDPYCEVHHIEPLGDGGADTPENVACLCPSHHREIHLGSNKTVLTEALKELRSKEA